MLTGVASGKIQAERERLLGRQQSNRSNSLVCTLTRSSHGMRRLRNFKVLVSIQFSSVCYASKEQTTVMKVS